MNYIPILEGLLFVVGDDGISVDQISEVLDIKKEEVYKVLEELDKIYNDDNRGITIKKYGNMYKLTTKKEYKEYYQRLFDNKEINTLSQSSLEVLAIIAYNEPITRVEIDELRGVNSSYVVRKLMAKNLIKEAGKSDLPGKPMLYKTTKDFLDCFGLSSIEDLPKLDDISNEEVEIDLFKTNKGDSDDIEIIE